MTEFIVKIAGSVIAVKSMYSKTKELFADYLTDELPLLSIESSKSLILTERKLMKQADENDSASIDNFSDIQIESNFLYREIAERLSEYKTVLIHGSAIAVDNEAYIFVAKSGTGKSTHTSLWRNVFKDRAVMINDDKPLLKCANDKIFVCGSPWNGKHHLSTNISVPLKAVCFLSRGSENEIKQIPETEAFFSMFKAVYHSKTAKREACILRLLHDIRQKTNFYQLNCNMKLEAAIVSYNGMKNKYDEG